MLQPGQAVQAEVENGLGLDRRQVVLAVNQAVLRLQLVRAAGVLTGALQHRQHVAGRPGLGDQFLARLGGARRCLDQLDDRVDVGQRYSEAFQRVAALAGLAQQVHRAPGDHFTPVPNEGLNDLLQVEHPWLAIDKRHHIDAKHRLQLGLRVQVVQHHIADFAATQLDNHAQAVLVGLVAQLGNAFNLLLFYQLRNALNEACLVQLVGDFVDDNDIPALFLLVNHLRFGTHVNAPAPRTVGLNDAGTAIDNAAGGEIRPGDEFHQFIHSDIRIGHQRQAAAHHFTQVVRRDIGGHAHRNTRGTIDEQRGDLGGQHHRDAFGAVVVVDEIDGFLVQIGQHGMGDLAHADFGVAHGGGGVAIHRTEVALPIDQHVTHGEGLGHTHDGVVDR